jgi:hypothetical protein
MSRTTISMMYERAGLALFAGSLAFACAGAPMEEPRPAQPEAQRAYAVEEAVEAPAAESEPPDREPPGPIESAWLALADLDGHGCADEDLIFDYGDGGGMRNFFCRALTVVSWKAFLDLAPVPPFLDGPHPEGKLELQAEHEFGRYDPVFVRWAVDHLIPAADDPYLRKRTQPTYDRAMRELARTYWETQRALAADPDWKHQVMQRYLEAVETGGVSSGLFYLSDVLGDANDNWGGYNPNHVRSATMWWLRRSHDDTEALWREGLERLLSTYDADWLRAHKGAWPGALPELPGTVRPEYK